MRILGIDPGSIVTGYGIVEDGSGSPLHVADGAVTGIASDTLTERLPHIFDGLQEVIKGYQPDAMAVESIFFARNAKSAAILGHARGVALLSAAKARLDVFEYSPMEVKKSVVGYGMATKEQVQKMVKSLLQMERLPVPDAADALAVAICHLHHRGFHQKIYSQRS
ncbi:MAG: crossover junction endodeoxyribonuclease RuvC [Thermodesulfobacteriota bacterium]